MKNTFLKTRTLGLTVAAVLATGSFCSTSYAAQKTTTIQVSATVAATCNISVSPIEFGLLSSTTVNIAQGVVAADCNMGTHGEIGLSSGANGIYTDNYGDIRRMVSASNPGSNESIAYQLTSDVAGNTPWGIIGSSGSQQFVSQQSGNALEIPIYAHTIDFADGLGSGTYSDTVIATIAY